MVTPQQIQLRCYVNDPAVRNHSRRSPRNTNCANRDLVVWFYVGLSHLSSHVSLTTTPPGGCFPNPRLKMRKLRNTPTSSSAFTQPESGGSLQHQALDSAPVCLARGDQPHPSPDAHCAGAPLRNRGTAGSGSAKGSPK